MSALKRLNSWSEEEAFDRFQACCGSERWARAMSGSRPFGGVEEIHDTAERIWFSLGREDWLEAFSHHPRIGDLKGARGASRTEQQGVEGADAAVMEEMIRLNAEYEERFGHVYLVCATGKSAPEMLDILKSRLGNTAAEELRNAAGEQAKITRIRLERILNEGGES